MPWAQSEKWTTSHAWVSTTAAASTAPSLAASRAVSSTESAMNAANSTPVGTGSARRTANVAGEPAARPSSYASPVH